MGRRAKFPQIAEQLHERIRAGEFRGGQALPPERELAGEFGVTRVTLRKAMNQLAADGIVNRQQGRGTFVNGDVKTAKQQTVLYIGSTEDHFYQAIHRHLCRQGQAAGKAVVAFTPNGDDRDQPQLQRLLRGVGAVISVAADWRWIGQLIPESIPVVRVTGFESFEWKDVRDNDRGAVITTDTFRATKLAVGHLFDRGHREIGLLDAGQFQGEGDPLLWHLRSSRLEYLGYRAGLSEQGLKNEYVLATPARDIPGYEDRDYQAARKYLEQLADRPTAFICIGDFRAGPLIRAAGDLGLRVPEDLSVVGMGNTPWAKWVSPPLTSVALGEDRIARLALSLASEPEQSPTAVYRVDPEIVERRSVKLLGEA